MQSSIVTSVSCLVLWPYTCWPTVWVHVPPPQPGSDGGGGEGEVEGGGGEGGGGAGGGGEGSPFACPTFKTRAESHKNCASRAISSMLSRPAVQRHAASARRADRGGGGGQELAGARALGGAREGAGFGSCVERSTSSRSALWHRVVRCEAQTRAEAVLRWQGRVAHRGASPRGPFPGPKEAASIICYSTGSYALSAGNSMKRGASLAVSPTVAESYLR